MPRSALIPKEQRAMKGILLWLVGLPIPIIIILYLIGVL